MDAGEKPVLIDVREPYEHEEFNIGGRNLPMGALQDWRDELEPHKDSEIIFYCRSGARSHMVTSMFKSFGFEGARNLLGGMIAWRDTE